MPFFFVQHKKFEEKRAKLITIAMKTKEEKKGDENDGNDDRVCAQN